MIVHLGVTGHRLGGLEHIDRPRLERRVDAALQAVRRAGGEPSPPVPTENAGVTLRVLSAVAEGADRIVAERALAQRCELYCVLPFARDAYERDFPTAASRAAYRALLRRAVQTLELGGVYADATQREAAYEAVGRAIIDRSEAILAIWDGQPAAGRGGTGQVVGESEARGLPVIWIHSAPPHRILVLRPSGDAGGRATGLGALGERLAALLATPA